jgi:hypothetical protein
MLIINPSFLELFAWLEHICLKKLSTPKLPWFKNLTFPQFSPGGCCWPCPWTANVTETSSAFYSYPRRRAHAGTFMASSSCPATGVAWCGALNGFFYSWLQAATGKKRFFGEMIFETTFSYLFIFWSSIFNTQNVDDTVSETMLNEVEAMFGLQLMFGCFIAFGVGFLEVVVQLR